MKITPQLLYKVMNRIGVQFHGNEVDIDLMEVLLNTEVE